MPFLQLDSEDPVDGLFFLEKRAVPVAGNVLVTGMAFLISSDGMVATCAHVPLVMGRIPGTRVKLFCASLPVVVDALVLDEGWRGPDWQRWIDDGWLDKNILALVDQRPEMFLEDIAFFRLLPETARWDDIRARPDAQDPAEMLTTRMKVLPLAAPEYPHASDTALQSWCWQWEGRGLIPVVGDARFRGAQPPRHTAIRLGTTSIGPGFSGSPVWDPARRRVVGMVRRGYLKTVADTVLGVDSRAIARHGRQALQPDDDCKQLLSVLKRIAAAFAPLRHLSLAPSSAPGAVLQLNVKPARAADILDEPDDAQPGQPAIENLLNLIAANPVSVLSGGAGTGKSTLLWQISEVLLSSVVRLGPMRIVPVIVSASEFVESGYDVRKILDASVSKYALGASRRTVSETFVLNEMLPLILLDGLDEIDRPSRAQVLSRLAGVFDASRAARILVATRPIDDLRIAAAGHSLQGWPVTELQHLQDEDVLGLASLWFPDAEKLHAFLDMLRGLAWDKRGPTPLQVAAAATLFRSGQIVERPVDLTFRLIDHLAGQGNDSAQEMLDSGALRRTGEDWRFANGIRSIFRLLGRMTVDGATTRHEIEIRLRSRVDFQFFDSPLELFRFLRREKEFLGGVVAVEGADGPGERIVWPHRSIAEALAAEDIAVQYAFEPLRALAAFQASVRLQGQSFAITLLAALDREKSTAAVDLSIVKTLNAGSSDYNSTLLAVRALGAGITTSAELKQRLVRTLIALLLMPPGSRLGPAKCEDLFRTDDLPAPLEVARRPAICRMIIEQLNERWRSRAASRHPPLYLSERESALLDQLAIWSDIAVPVARGTGQSLSGALTGGPCPGPSVMARGRPVESAAHPIVSAALLTHALQRMRLDADGFFSDFVGFARGVGAGLPDEAVAEMYIAGLISGLREHHL